MTTAEFLEWMVEAGYNMTEPRNFKFDMDGVRDAEHARTIQFEIERQGLTTRIEIVDGEVYFEIIARIMPLLNEVLDIERLLEPVALRLDARYIGFGI